MLPVSPVQIDVKPERSFNNWTCCFGCRCWKAVNSEEQKEQDSPGSMREIETVTRIYERHRHSASPTTTPNPPLRKLLALQAPSSMGMPSHLGSTAMVSPPPEASPTPVASPATVQTPEPETKTDEK